MGSNRRNYETKIKGVIAKGGGFVTVFENQGSYNCLVTVLKLFFVLENKENKGNTENTFNSHIFLVLKNIKNTKNTKFKKQEQF